MKKPVKKSQGSCAKKPEIDYPCLWQYKVIGEDPARIEETIRQACGAIEVLITPSHSSSGGKYHSLNAELVVPDEQTKNKIFQLLCQGPGVKMVI